MHSEQERFMEEALALAREAAAAGEVPVAWKWARRVS